MRRSVVSRFATLLSSLLVVIQISAQPEVQAWSNITGIRVDGQLLRFESSLRLAFDDWQREWATARERQQSGYLRQGEAQVVQLEMDDFLATQTVRDTDPGQVRIQLTVHTRDTMTLTGAFYHLALPAADFAGAMVELIAPTALPLAGQPFLASGPNERLRAYAQGLRVHTARRELVITTPEPLLLVVREDAATGALGLYFTLRAGSLPKDWQRDFQFDISISGISEAEPAGITLFPAYPGNTFLGLGGNFRLQNMENDPQVIDYCLNNLEVRMGRVELPWDAWHPTDTINPLAAARQGLLHPKVKAAMEMAQRLHEMGMPVLLAAWYPPQWAARGTVRRNPRHPDGTFGFPLRDDRLAAIYASIADYILYLREAYGVEVDMFSFNESDLGINVRQTAEEHAAFIKGLGAALRARGLSTRLLLGDTSDANSFAFVDDALDDPETWPFIGAISFHSWRGWEKQTLLEWYEAADRLNVPLIVGEGSIDAAAWRYPGIFEETHYATEEIKLYLRILRICQPESILQWQLTADYSPLVGGGIFGNDSLPLQPTQRFWNLKQLAQTPAGYHFLPVTCDQEELTVAALSDRRQRRVVVHIVNDGAAREVVLQGLPERVRRLRLSITDAERGMADGGTVEVGEDGTARFQVDPACFISLWGE